MIHEKDFFFLNELVKKSQNINEHELLVWISVKTHCELIINQKDLSCLKHANYRITFNQCEQMILMSSSFKSKSVLNLRIWIHVKTQRMNEWVKKSNIWNIWVVGLNQCKYSEQVDDASGPGLLHWIG